MTTQVELPVSHELLLRVAAAARHGLASRPKWLPAWLFYDDAGSQLFEEITDLPEYYLTRVERSILSDNAAAILEQAAEGERLRIVELGAGSASKTRLLLLAAVERQDNVVYEPIDVSASALEEARERIEREIPEVEVVPRVMDYTRELNLDPAETGERNLVFYIGSSIGNFELDDAARLLRRVRSKLRQGDGLLLGVDLCKDERTLVAAYDDPQGVTAAFNLNLLVRLNRDLGANFNPATFAHRALWNSLASRIEMHLESRIAQTVHVAALGLDVEFAEGETIHTENSYKFPPGAAEALLSEAGFTPVSSWTDDRAQFAVCLARAE